MSESGKRRYRNGGGNCENRKISYFSAVDLANAAAAVAAKCIRCSMLRTFPHKFVHVYLLNRFKFSPSCSLSVSIFSHTHTLNSHLYELLLNFFNDKIHEYRSSSLHLK